MADKSSSDTLSFTRHISGIIPEKLVQERRGFQPLGRFANSEVNTIVAIVLDDSNSRKCSELTAAVLQF